MGKNNGILVIALLRVSIYLKSAIQNGKLIYKQTFRETSILLFNVEQFLILLLSSIPVLLLIGYVTVKGESEKGMFNGKNVSEENTVYLVGLGKRNRWVRYVFNNKYLIYLFIYSK